MQLTCKVNQAEAIRRGFDSNATIKLEINPVTLTPEERATLADNFSYGEFKQGHSDRQIPEPTVEGFLETLRGLARKAAEAKVAEEQSRLAQIANTGKNFHERTTRATSPQIYANLIDGEVKLCERYGGDIETRATLSYARIEPHKEYESDDKEWSRLLATPEGIAWQAELDAINAEARAKVETDVTTQVHRRVQRLADKALELEDFRQWALTHGSETLRLRVEEGFKWQSLAEGEWADSILTRAGITDTPLPDMLGFDQESEESEQPTAAQIHSLRRIREALASLPDVPTEVAIRDFTYTEEIPDEDNMGQDPETIKRTEVCVDIATPTPTGSEVTRYFIA